MRGLVYFEYDHNRIATFSELSWLDHYWVKDLLQDITHLLEEVLLQVGVQVNYRIQVQSYENATYELVWIKDLNTKHQISTQVYMCLQFDNIVTIHIAENPISHEYKKHIKIDCYVIQ